MQVQPTDSLPTVAVVVLSYNGRELLARFLPGIVADANLQGQPFSTEVWVVDNASTDGTELFLHENFPSVKVIRIEVNKGFTNGYVESLPLIPADYYVLINTDVEVTPGWLAPLVQLAETDPKIAAIQPRILAQTQKTHFEYSGAAGGYIDKYGYPFCRGRVFFTVEEDQGQYNDSRQVFWASGACLFIRAARYHQAGGLDNDFYAHMEEIDLCWRLQSMGFSIWVCPASVVYHVGGHVIKYGSPEKLYHNYRNSLIMLLKNLPGRMLWGRLFFRMVLDGIAAWRALLAGHPAEFGAVLRAHGHFWQGLGRWRTKRKAVQLLTVTDATHSPGWFQGSTVWAYFAKGRKTFAEVVK